MLFAGLRSVRMVKTCIFQMLLIAIADKIDRHTETTLMETLALNFGH